MNHSNNQTNMQSTASLPGANPLLLSQLFGQMNPANKQSVLDPSNLDARTLSAITNREPASAGIMSGDYNGNGSAGDNIRGDNIGSTVNSLQFVGENSEASQKPATAQQESANSGQLDF